MRRSLKFLLFFVPLVLVIPAGGVPSRTINPPTVQYCDLIANPALYDGKQIRLHGIYSVAGSGYSRFFSSSCPDKTLWVEYDANYETCSGRNAINALATMRRKSGGRWARPHVSVITVRFRNAELNSPGDLLPRTRSLNLRRQKRMDRLVLFARLVNFRILFLRLRA